MTRSMPGPLSYKTIQKFSQAQVARFKLHHVRDLSGAQVDIDRVLVDLISQLPKPPDHVHIQVLGDGFRAMRKQNFVNIGIRLLCEDAGAELINNSFSSLATL